MSNPLEKITTGLQQPAKEQPSQIDLCKAGETVDRLHLVRQKF
jgi:hypothetical protein